MIDLSQCLRAYAVGDEDVTDGTVENYDFDWGEPVQPKCRCGGTCGWGAGRCACGGRCGCGGCTAQPDPDPDPVEDPPTCGCGSATAPAQGDEEYPILDL